MLRSIRMLPVLYLLLSTVSVAQKVVQKQPVAAVPSNFPDKQLMQRIMDAWGTLDPSAASKYYDQSSANIFYDDAGGVKFVGWQEYENKIRTVMAMLQAVKWTVNDDAMVHAAGSYAWGTATVHARYLFKNGTRQEMNERWTLIWAKRGENWLVVHEHFSAPPSD